MVSIPRFSALPPEQSVALVRVIALLPISVVVNWFPNSEATVDAGMMIFGTVTAGVVVTVRSVGSDAAGLYAGFLGGILELVTFAVTAGTTVAWPLSRVAFFTFAGGVVVCLASMSDLGHSRIGGWLMWTVDSRWNPTASTSQPPAAVLR